MTPHFSIEELTRTETGLPNMPATLDEISNLKTTAAMMEHVRLMLAEPVIVTSAFRSEEVNKKVGGSLTSSHRFGYAVDFKTRNKTPWQIVLILSNSWLFFDQLINEQEKGIVHISFAPQYRREVLTQIGRNFVKGNIKR